MGTKKTPRKTKCCEFCMNNAVEGSTICASPSCAESKAETDKRHGPIREKAAKAKDRITGIKMVVEHCKKQIRLDQQVVNNGKHNIAMALGEALDIPWMHIELGGWECPSSPTGECFYDARNDPALDECLMCGGPDERK